MKSQSSLTGLRRKRRNAIGYFRFSRDVLIVSDTHEVTYDLMRRTYQQTKNIPKKLFGFVQYKLGKREELRLCRMFDALIATTKRDEEVFRMHLPNQKIFVVQNGVDASFLERQDVEPEQRTMVFTGMMRYYPNNHGILFFLDEVFPLILAQASDSRLYIVGAHPTRELLKRASEQVIVTGFVEDVPALYGAGGGLHYSTFDWWWNQGESIGSDGDEEADCDHLYRLRGY